MSLRFLTGLPVAPGLTVVVATVYRKAVRDAAGARKAMPYCYEWPRPAVTSDVCALVQDPQKCWHVLVIRRANPPFAGMHALPGGFLDVDREDVEACARREFKEETGIEAPVKLHLLGVWSDPRRDPRGHVVTPVWLALFGWPPPEPQAGDDAAAARWLPVTEARPLAFDHEEMVAKGLLMAEAILKREAFLPDISD